MSSVAGESNELLPDLVSICIPTHNRAHLLPRAVESALAQTYAPIEVVVVSDGSSDATPQVLERLAASHASLRYVCLPVAKGACAARNRAFALARGQFVVGLDDDDVLAPDHVARLMAAYRPEYAFVASSQLVVYPDRRVPFALDEGLVSLDALLHYNRFGPQLLVERERVLAIGGFDEGLAALQDYDLCVRLIEAYGPALKTGDTTYEVHWDGQVPRISSGIERKLQALSRFRDKHAHLMSPSHRKSMRLLEIREAGRPLSLHQAVSLLQRGNQLSVLSHLVNTRLPWAQRLYHRRFWRAG